MESTLTPDTQVVLLLCGELGQRAANCAEPQTEDWLATHMDVRRAQLKDWLDRAIAEGRIKKLRNPVRYAAISRTLFAG